jgi:UrcA family protein
MSTTLVKSFAALTLAATFVGASAPACAGEPPNDSGGIKVKFDRLDFNNAAAVADLYRRIRLSAHLVCTDTSSPWDASREQTYKRCYSGTVDKAVAQVNRPQLTALHQGKEQPVRVGARTP